MQSSVSSAASGRLVSVLIVDADAADARLIEEYLLRVREACYLVDWAGDLETARECLAAGVHDVCLCDWHLGAESGADVLRAVREQGLELPVVILTSSLDPEIDDEAQALGAANLLDKNDVGPSELHRALCYARVRQQSESTLRQRAQVDPLTGVYRRERFLRHLARGLEEARRGRSWEVCIVFLDLDGFKEINDTLGHGAGDRVLKAVGQRLNGVVRGRDLVARMGGDEFAVLVQGHRGRASARAVRERVEEALARPLVLDGLEVSFGASVGLAWTTTGDIESEELLGEADRDMYQRKAVRRLQVAGAPVLLGPKTLLGAFDRQEFVLEYQPVLDASTGWVLGLEALVRWNHPEHGRLLPATFMPAAEKLGFMRLLGEWVLNTACERLVEWQRRFGQVMPGLRVNLSADQFRDPLLQDALLEALESHRLNPHQLCVEIDESALRSDEQEIVDKIKQIRSIGVRLSLDSYGRDQLVLDTLARFMLDEVKLAPRMLAGLHRNPRRLQVLRALMGLCRELGVEVAAKNVETAAQARVLAGLGCSRQQGRYYQGALPEDQVPVYLLEQHLPAAC